VGIIFTATPLSKDKQIPPRNRKNPNTTIIVYGSVMKLNDKPAAAEPNKHTAVR
jgi:hypothetical protein